MNKKMKYHIAILDKNELGWTSFESVDEINIASDIALNLSRLSFNLDCKVIIYQLDNFRGKIIKTYCNGELK